MVRIDPIGHSHANAKRALLVELPAPGLGRVAADCSTASTTRVLVACIRANRKQAPRLGTRSGIHKRIRSREART